MRRASFTAILSPTTFSWSSGRAKRRRQDRRFWTAKIEAGQRLTQDGTVVGTAEYISPEQVTGKTPTRGAISIRWLHPVMSYHRPVAP